MLEKEEKKVVDFADKKKEKAIKDSIEAHREWAKETIAAVGWICHLVPPLDLVHANYHTHGLMESFGHLDLQIQLAIHPDLAHTLLNDVGQMIKDGQKFEEGERYNNIIQNFDVEFKVFREQGRDVLRLLLPDPKGVLPTEVGCEPLYRTQLAQLDDEEESE